MYIYNIKQFIYLPSVRYYSNERGSGRRNHNENLRELVARRR